MKHERRVVHDGGVRQPHERVVEHLEHAVVVLRDALLLEPAVDVDVRLLVVPAVDVHARGVLQLQREDEQDELAPVVAAVHEVAVEHVHVLRARRAELAEDVKEVVLTRNGNRPG